MSKGAYSPDTFGEVNIPEQMPGIHLSDVLLPSDGQYTVVVDTAPKIGDPGDDSRVEYELRLMPIEVETDAAALAVNTKAGEYVSGLGNQDTYTFEVDSVRFDAATASAGRCSRRATIG